MTLSWTLDKLGPLCRYVEDTALVLAALNGDDPHDPAAAETGFSYDGNMDLSGIRLGYDPRAFEGDNVTQADRDALAAARALGADIREIALPDRKVRPLRLQIAAETGAAFQELLLNDRDDLLRVQTNGARAAGIRRVHHLSAVDLVQVDRLRRQVMEDMARVFETCDVIIGPNYAREMLVITNYTGHPVLGMRAGFVEREVSPAWEVEGVPDGTMDRLPHNISLWADLYQEGKILAVGRALEAALGVADERPNMD